MMSRIREISVLIFFTSMLVQCGDSGSPVPEEKSTIELSSVASVDTDQNRSFFYRIDANSNAGDTILYFAWHPSWMQYNEESRTLTGIPGWPNLNRTFQVTVAATNLIDTARVTFAVNVVLGEVVCDAQFGSPSESEYILPYKTGESYRMWQSYCHPQWSHKDWFSYDFDMPMGTEIIASRAGTVIFERDNFADGTRVSGEENFVFIQHSDGTVVHYVHLMQHGSLVEVGQFVQQGEVIGLSGDSGGSAGPHLHTTQFIGRTSFNRQYSIPMNYSNAEGPLNANNGLVIDKFYKALPF